MPPRRGVRARRTVECTKRTHRGNLLNRRHGHEMDQKSARTVRAERTHGGACARPRAARAAATQQFSCELMRKGASGFTPTAPPSAELPSCRRVEFNDCPRADPATMGEVQAAKATTMSNEHDADDSAAAKDDRLTDADRVAAIWNLPYQRNPNFT